MSSAAKMFTQLMRQPFMVRFNSRFADPIDGFVRRVTGGRVLSLAGWAYDEMVLHSLGAKSGQWRENTLLYATDEDGTLHVVGTNFGGDTHPGWTWNLLANPAARVTVDGVDRDVEAEQLTADEMEAMWSRFDRVYPGYADYRAKVGDSRPIRMFRLTDA